jgi:hypothetical protein
MKIILFTILLSLQLLAINPKVYSALGDKLYDNLQYINDLQTNRYFSAEKDKIKEYVFSVKALKGIGYSIDQGDFGVTKQEYLENLRKLSKTNDYFVIKVKKLFFNAMDEKNSNLFISMIKTGLVDTQRYKSEIKEYYYKHKGEIDISGTVIEKFVAEDEAKKKKKPVYTGPTKEELQKAKIERIRAKDKARQEAIQKALEEELREKKLQIREEQKKELKTR